MARKRGFSMNTWASRMKHTEHAYIDVGYRFEKACRMSVSWARCLAADIRRMIESESLDDQVEARRLIERGRKEANEG